MPRTASAAARRRPHGHAPRPPRSRACLGAALLYLLLPAAAAAQTPTRDSYYESLPPPPAIIAETEPTVRFRLYGDPADSAYVDVRPRDGVDDAQGDWLMTLAEHFSPILRRNTYTVPLEFEDALASEVAIHLDAWRDHLRVDSGVVRLGHRVTDGGAYASGGAPLVAPDDDLLLELLQSRGPRRARSRVTPAAPPTDTILFIDVPGEDELSWKPHHAERLPERSRIYAHPFIYQHAGPTDSARYELLLQYWFYYPFNDGGNNHEGDWEHITTSITSHATLEASGERGLLSEAQLRAILDPRGGVPLDSLRIRTVAYYFHNNVMVVPYLDIEAGETMWRRADHNDGSIHVWEDTRYMDHAIRRRMTMAGGRLATHPVGYIGGNNKGTDELLHFWPRFGRSFNRDSHGTYPFPGTWRKVGPLDATEKIMGDVVPRVHLTASGEVDLSREWYELIDDDRYMIYRRDDIVLLPDWERLEPLVLDPAEAEVRRRWAWFILPVHLGFPAVASPGAGTLKRVDLGNVAPMSPAYNTAWNRPGPTAVYPPYHPTVLRVALAPISPLASLQSGWGVLNIPIVAWSLLPGGSVAVSQLLPWLTGGMHVLGAPPAKTFYLGELPERFTSVSGGTYHQIGGKDFARMLPEPEHPAVRALLGENASGELRMTDAHRVSSWGSRAWFNVYFGPRISLENTLDYGASDVSYTVENEAGEALGRVMGRLHMREVTGGINYRLTPPTQEWLRLYGRAGYGWTSYTLSGVNVDGQSTPREGTRVRGGHLPTLYPSIAWWPNTTYLGLGTEVFTPPRYWLLKRLGVGARVEVGASFHRMAIAGDCNCRVTTERGDVAAMLLFGW